MVAVAGLSPPATYRRFSPSRLRASEVAIVLLPATLAAEAGGQKRFELQATTVGEALRQLPVTNLLFDKSGELRRLINVFVDGEIGRAHV